MKITAFEDLEIWKLSIGITLDIYKLTYGENFKRDYSLCDQIRRALISVSSNIVEGFERNNNNEFIYYLRIAKGSAGEVRSQLFISAKLGYLTEKEYEELSEQLLLLSSKIGKFISYLSMKKKNHEFITR